MWDTTSFYALPQYYVDLLKQPGRFESGATYGEVECDDAKQHTLDLLAAGDAYVARWNPSGRDKPSGEQFDDWRTDWQWIVVLEGLSDRETMLTVIHEAYHWGADVDDPIPEDAEKCYQEPPPNDDDDTEDSNSGGEGGGGTVDLTDDDGGGGDDEEEPADDEDDCKKVTVTMCQHGYEDCVTHTGCSAGDC